ncbi:MAG TPA: hypothetical protein VMV92_23790 [Streptosporangiaceae bacterium]|nr:hypothetical protein [Streptosporangiaceae bacterium]
MVSTSFCWSKAGVTSSVHALAARWHRVSDNLDSGVLEPGPLFGGYAVR